MDEKNYFNEVGKKLTGENNQNSPIDGHELDAIQQIWNLSGNYSYAEESSNDSAWSKLSSELTTTPVLKVSWIRRNAWAVAASFTLLVLATGGVLFWKNQAPTQIAALTEKTGNHETKTITLEDGSVISLKSNGIIKIAAGFNQNNRKIELIGEASFEVAPNKKIPFEVTADKSITQVLGTGFNIKAYPAENVFIAVSHGKVQFGNGKSTLILEKGAAAKFDIASNTIENIEPVSDVFWNDGFVFKKASLQSISTELKHNYGKGLKFDVKYANKQFTGKFNSGTSMEDIAKTLQEALGVQITIEK